MGILTIRARGMCAVIPTSDGSGMRIVMVNGIQPGLSKLNPSYIIEPHYPFIAIPEELIPDEHANDPHLYAKIFVRGSNAFKAVVHEDGPVPVRTYHGIFVIPNYKIEIKTDSTMALSVKNNTPKSPQAKVLTTDDAASLYWTVDLPRITPPAGIVRPEVMSSNPPADLVAAFVDFDKGKVSSSAITDQEYSFVNTQQPYKQRLAFQLMVNIDVSSPPTIVLTERRDGGDVLELKLKKASDDQYTIVLDNTALDEIVGIQRALGTYPWHSNEPYYHYEMLYKLSAQPPEKAIIPVTPELTPDLDPPMSKCAPLSSMKVTSTGA